MSAGTRDVTVPVIASMASETGGEKKSAERKSGRTRRRRRCGRYRTSDARTGAGTRGSNQTSSGFRFAGRCGDMTCHPHGG